MLIKLIKSLSDMLYDMEQKVLLPAIVAVFPPGKVPKDRDVLHTGHLSTKPRVICTCLKESGLKADYLAFTHRFSRSSWLRADVLGADFLVNPLVPLSFLGFWGEVWRFYRVVLRYKVLHCHSLRFPSDSGWELPYLKGTGTKIVIHYRGCDIRNPELYLKSAEQGYHYACEQCDYAKSYCKNKRKEDLRHLAEKFGDCFLVTTPDLLDFVPHARLIPFFAPLSDFDQVSPKRASKAQFEVVHATNHEGIDGTRHIIEAVERLKSEGHDVHLNILKRCPYDEAMLFYKGADLAVGKLFMGFYANFQVETMMLGTPTACYIRGDLKKYMNGIEIIEVSPETVYNVLKRCISEPEKLKALGNRQREQAGRVHNNKELTSELVELYKKLTGQEA